MFNYPFIKNSSDLNNLELFEKYISSSNFKTLETCPACLWNSFSELKVNSSRENIENLPKKSKMHYLMRTFYTCAQDAD